MQQPLLDVVVLRPKDPEQLALLASRLQLRLPGEWRRTLRWAGRAMLVSRAGERTAEQALSAAREAGLTTLTRQSHPEGSLDRFLTAHAGALGRAAFAAAALGTAWRLFFVDAYNLLVHFAGLLWLQLVTRDPAVFRVAGRSAGIAASLAIGYLAMISVHVALAWVRLSPPLLSRAPESAQREVFPVPPTRSFNWLRLWPAAAGAVVVAAGWFAAQRVFRPPRKDGTTSALVAVPEARRAQGLLPSDPWKARAELEDRTRPRPDRRLMLAFEDVQLLIQGRRPQCAADWADQGWRIRCENAPVAWLPEVPSWPEALKALRARARQLGPLRGTAVPRFAGMTDEDALARLRELQPRWRAGDAEARHQAASALVALATHALDTMEVGDALPARALAVLALDEDAHDAAEPQLEALLALAMGYGKSARSIASTLPEGDPVRAWVVRDDAAMQEAATIGAPFLRLLWLRRLQALERTGEAERWRRERLGPLANTVAALHGPLLQTQDVRAGSIRATLPAVKDALEQQLASSASDSAWRQLRSALWGRSKHGPLLDAFESDLRDAFGAGVLIDRAVGAAYFRGALYSGISTAFVQLNEHQGAPEEARSFLESLGTFPDAPATDLAIWAKGQLPYATGHEYTRGKPGAEQLAASLHLGPGALEQVLRHANGDAESSDRAARIVVARMDTRPEHRRLLVTDALYSLRDPALARRACVALLLEDDNSLGAAVCARTLRDRERLLAVARSPANPLWLRAMALRFLWDVQLAPGIEIDAEFDKLLPLDDGWARVVQAYSELLERRGEYAHARSVVEGWLPTPRGASIVEQNVRTTRARMLYLEGNPREAWRELEQLAQSGNAGVMMRASYVLSALGRKDEAEAMARRRLVRLPTDWDSLTVLVELLWRHGKADEAANILRRPPFRIEVDEWRTRIGAAFAKAFAGGRDAEALAAFGSLQQAGLVRRSLREIAMAEELRSTLARAMLSRLLETGPADPVMLVRNASLIQDIDGEAAAAAWLRAHIPEAEAYSFARVLYARRQDALLWAALPDPLPVSAADEIWLLRAAAAARTPEERSARGGALQDHFRATAGTEAYLLGRYLSGLAGEDSIRGGTRRTRAAWALGVRAEAEGHRADAVAWHQVAAVGGSPTEAERGFAVDTLARWADEAVKVPVRAVASK